MVIREARYEDLFEILRLYEQLNVNPVPQESAELDALWKRILADENYYLLVAEVDGAIVSSSTVIVVPNLTRTQRSYALVENVVTHAEHRGRGYATAVLARAREIAVEANCYKMMLMTGSKHEETLSFYRRAGYNSQDKTAFIQWL